MIKLSHPVRCFEWMLVLLFTTALFLLLTNAIPFIDAGWMTPLRKKSDYVCLTAIPLIVFYVVMIVLYWANPRFFESLAIVRLWNKITSFSVMKIAATFFLVYGIVLSCATIERHLALETRAFDLGIFSQAVWNTTQGHFLFSSIKENICLLGDHVSPILLFTVPFYGIWPDPRSLIILQVISAAFAFFPLAQIARDKLQNSTLVFIFLLTYFFFYPMRSTLHEDFHPEVLAEPFLWWAFIFIDKNRTKSFLVCLVFAAMGKESFLGIVAVLGLYTAFFEGAPGPRIEHFLYSMLGFCLGSKMACSSIVK